MDFSGERSLRVQKARSKTCATFSLLILVGLCGANVFAQSRPPVDDDYQAYFVHYVDKRSIWDKALNQIDVESNEIGRSFALIAGVSHYPNMPRTQTELAPAAADIRNLQNYLKDYEFFDEIVVLSEGDVNLNTLQFFLQTYFPERLKKFPKSRFLFAYSGHGMTDSTKGYLLKSSARSLSDKQNAVNLDVVRIFIDEVVESGHHVLVLINACYSGAFLKRGMPFGGSRQLIPQNPGAHAITAGGTGELTWHLPQVGQGSVFFEKIFAGLDGRADVSPEDGVVNAWELFAYLKGEVQISTEQEQNPQIGDISKHGSKGEFFFLNRDRQVRQGVLPVWNPSTATSFGKDAASLLQTALSHRNVGQYSIALDYLHQAANKGSGEAMYVLGYMHNYGEGMEPDFAKAADWYRKGADANNVSAMADLGLMYEDGKGVKKDEKMAVYWLDRAANEGHALAMTMLAYYYRSGHVVPKDYDTALRLAQRSAEAGSNSGMLLVGFMHDVGEGVPVDKLEAFRWYRKAAAAGNNMAANFIETTDFDAVIRDLLERFYVEHWMVRQLELTKGQRATLKWFLKEHGIYWGNVYVGLCFAGVGLVPTDTEESKARVQNILDVAAQLWAGRNLSGNIQGESAKDAITELSRLLRTRSSAGPLEDADIQWIREQLLNRPDLFILDEFSADGPSLRRLGNLEPSIQR